MEEYLGRFKYMVLYSLLFLTPLFFLPITQEFFVTNKLYLLAFGGLFLLLCSVGELLFSRKLVWKKNMFDGPVVLFLLTVGLSILINSPNKIQALLNPNFGLVTLCSLAILYFYFSRASEIMRHWINFLFSISSLFLSLTTIIFFFHPFESTPLSLNLQFLKNPGFNLFGNQIDLAIMLGFFVLYELINIIKNEESKKKVSIFNFVFLVLNFLALALTFYMILKPPGDLNQQSFLLPPFTISWYAAVETLKNPITALFGVGVDNFSSMFARVKDVLYNQSTLWQINSFTVSRSALLHIFTETGLFGFVTFVILVVNGFKKILVAKHLSFELAGFVFVLLMMALFPPSLPLFFLFFFMLSILAKEDANNQARSFDMSEIIPLYLGCIILSVVLIGGGGYLLGRVYASEFYFKRALDGIVRNNLKDLYDNERQAIILNPFIERFRINFSQTNLLIANNIASKATQPSASKASDKQSMQLSQEDRQTIGQGVQAAIAEAKAAVGLNPQKAENWANLAVIYRNILNVAQGADVWTISAYQRAVVLDPQNPLYRLNLGGVYYSLNNFDEATKMFEQAVTLKPDWANAHYNLAWGSYQKGDYQRAVSEMQNVLSLLNPQKDQTDYQKAQKDLEEFKKKLPKTEEQTTKGTENQQPSQLTLPTPQPTIEPKIQLPKNASPEAK